MVLHCIGILITLLAILLPLPVLAAFELEPRLVVREEFTDNLYLDDADEESDFITTVAPGVLLSYDARLLDLELDYSLHFLQYLHHDEEDETRLKDTQRVRFQGELLPDQDFSLSVVDEYQRVTIDSRRQVDDDNPFVNKSNRNRLVVNPEYRCRRLATFVPVVGYRYERLDYDEPEGDDSERHDFYADLEKELNPKMTVTLGYLYGIYQAQGDLDDEEEDYRRQDLTSRFDYQFSPAFTLHAGVGSAWIDYKERSDEQALTWDVALDWQPGSRWQAGLAYSEDFAVSVNEGLSRNRRAEARLSHLERIPWELRLYAEKQNYRTEDREDRAVGLNARVSVPLHGRLSLDLTGEGSLWRFLPEDEDVFRCGAGLALSYRIRFGLLSVGYRFRESNSDLDENDYQSNLAYVQLSLTF
jgi:hypothetical protein